MNTWPSNAHITCIADCGDPTPEYGTSSSNIFLNPTTLTISCDLGYELSGPTSITCQADGTWSSRPTCELKDCGDPTPADGTSNSTTFTYPTTLLISCDLGYVLAEPSSITCQADSTWSYTSSCEPKVKNSGSNCSSVSDCNEANAVCLMSTCFCNYYSKYSASVRDCVQDCTSMLNTFEKHTDTYILSYNSLGDTTDTSTVFTADGCKQKCLDKPGCVAVEYRLMFGYCFFSEISLQMMMDANPDIIRHLVGRNDMYVRTKINVCNY